MVLYVMKWEIGPDVDAYKAWTSSAIERLLKAPGVVEFRAYRAVAGSGQVVATYEFKDVHTCGAWLDDVSVRQVREELEALASNVTAEIWGPSPIVPEPIRPGG